MRTNNHVERTNRMLRFLEKVRYKWRRRKTLVRFVVMRLDDLEPLDALKAQAKTTPGRNRSSRASHKGMTDYNHVRSRETAVVMSEECRFFGGRGSQGNEQIAYRV